MSTYNHDLDVDDAFAGRFPAIRRLLVQPKVVEEFKRFDATAKLQKRRFHTLGAVSLVLASAALLGLCFQLLLAAYGMHVPPFMHVGSDVAALAAFAIALGLRLAKTKHRYLHACFARERIRQWHFQMFLDGTLVGSALRDEPNAKQELARRWERLCDLFKNLDGAVQDFLARPHAASELYHPVSPYADRELGAQIMAALRTLRVDHQVQYPERRIAAEQTDHALSLKDHFEWSEVVARVTLVSAVALAASGIVLSILNLCNLVVPAHLVPTLAISALASTVISAASRAYQAGFTVPAEIDSYLETAAQMDHLRTRFLDANADVSVQQTVLRDLEIAAASELRRFVSIKRRATFLV